MRARTNYIAIHCSATPPEMDIGVKQIRQWHLDKGWRDVGYQYIVTRGGLVQIGRPEEERGAHVRGYNNESIGICMVGGVDRYNNPEDNFTKEQWVALGALVTGLKAKYTGAYVLGHRDFPDVKKDCPCFDVGQWWAAYQERL